MKNWMVLLLSLALACVCSAEDVPTFNNTKKKNGMGMGMGMGMGGGKPQFDIPECAELKAACEAAGYKLGRKIRTKNLIRDCLVPKAKGEKVPGIVVKGDQKACLAAYESWKKSRRGRRGMGMGMRGMGMRGMMGDQKTSLNLIDTGK